MRKVPIQSRMLKNIGTILLLVISCQGQTSTRFVVLPPRAASGIASSGTRQPTKDDIDGLEASLSQVSSLKAVNWPTSSNIRIDHPEQYLRQYVAVIRGGRKEIYINALCDQILVPDWRQRLVVVSDGATCFWQALYDPTTKRYSDLRQC